MSSDKELSAEYKASLSPKQARELFRSERWSGSTRGFSLGYLQCGIAILPQVYADDFLKFCLKNGAAVPLLDMTDVGSAFSNRYAEGADLRTDLPSYQVFENGVFSRVVTEVTEFWRPDMVCFVIGCAMTFDAAMEANGIPNRQMTETGKPTMFLTNIDCEPAGIFSGRMLVSMRPMLPSHAIRAIQISSRFPRTHGAPVHFGDPSTIGIASIDKPDIGAPVRILPGEVPVFWPCLGTIWNVVQKSKPEIFISHAPGHMLIADLTDQQMSTL
jgi:uncharacterized protein YcsI (UPF0317 family)